MTASLQTHGPPILASGERDLTIRALSGAFLFWILFISSGTITVVGDITHLSSTVLLVPSYAFIVATVILRVDRVAVLVGNIKIGLLLPIAALASAYWSVSPDTSRTEALRLIVHIATAVSLTAWFPTLRVFRMLAYALFVACVLSLALYYIDRPAALDELHKLKGFFQTKNIIGFAASIAFLTFFHYYIFIKRDPLYAGACAFLLGVVLFSDSATSVVIMASGAGFSLAYRAILASTAGKLSLVRFLGLCSLVGATGSAVYFGFDLLLEALGRDPTLTGREGLWKIGRNLIAHRPMLGYGYQVLANDHLPLTMKIVASVGSWARQFHNSYINISFQLGYVGLFLNLLFYAMIIIGVYREGRANGPHYAALMGSFIIAFAVQSFTESTFGGPRSLATLVLYLMLLRPGELSLHRKRLARSTAAGRTGP